MAKLTINGMIEPTRALLVPSDQKLPSAQDTRRLIADAANAGLRLYTSRLIGVPRPLKRDQPLPLLAVGLVTAAQRHSLVEVTVFDQDPPFEFLAISLEPTDEGFDVVGVEYGRLPDGCEQHATWGYQRNATGEESFTWAVPRGATELHLAAISAEAGEARHGAQKLWTAWRLRPVEPGSPVERSEMVLMQQFPDPSVPVAEDPGGGAYRAVGPGFVPFGREDGFATPQLAYDAMLTAIPPGPTGDDSRLRRARP